MQAMAGKPPWFGSWLLGFVCLKGGILLLLITMEGHKIVPPTNTDSLLSHPKYEEAFRRVVAKKTSAGTYGEETIQHGVDYLVAHGVAPEDASANLRKVILSFEEEQTQQEKQLQEA